MARLKAPPDWRGAFYQQWVAECARPLCYVQEHLGGPGRYLYRRLAESRLRDELGWSQDPDGRWVCPGCTEKEQSGR